MPLLLLDLDNTLVDRSGAFARWALRYVQGLGRGADDCDWLVAADAEGYRPRDELADRMADRFALSHADRSEIVVAMRAGLVEEMVLDPRVVCALVDARAAGWLPFALTNGTVAQQERKIRYLGLDEYLGGWMISEAAGCKKPDPRIFELAAAASGLPLVAAWMVGDHPLADIKGAHGVGISSVWVQRGRAWTDASYCPTHEAENCAGAIQHILKSDAQV